MAKLRRLETHADQETTLPVHGSPMSSPARETLTDVPALLEEEADDLPMRTILFCTDNRLPPVPEIYQVIYNHLKGEDATLNSIIMSALSRGPLTYSFIMEIYNDFFHVSNVAAGLGKIGDGLEATVDEVSTLIGESMSDGKKSSTQLHRLSRAITKAPSRHHVAEITKEIQKISIEHIKGTARMGEALCAAQKKIAMLEREISKHVATANTDHLTEIANRRAMDSALEACMKRRLKSTAPDCFIMIDLDRFKYINDTFGHDVGDSILKRLATVIRDSIGDRKGVTPARWGGEEFVVLVEAGGQETASAIAETIRETLESYTWTRRDGDETIGTVTASFGISSRLSSDTVESFTKRADEALYRAKRGGRNRTFLEERNISPLESD